jgi:hypothetical protein
VPQDQTLLHVQDIPEDALGSVDGRSNYPMVLARLFDEEGGRAFMLEYSSQPPRFQPAALDPSFFGGVGDCCTSADAGNDLCGLRGDSQCQCPLGEADEQDCADFPDVVAGVRMVEDLAERYARVTRITTRLSAHEMTFDPMFEADERLAERAQVSLSAREGTLAACRKDLLEGER